MNDIFAKRRARLLAMKAIRDNYGSLVRVFQTEIPFAVRAAEVPEKGQSIYTYDPNGRVAKAYEALTKEVMEIGSREHEKIQDCHIR